MNIRQLKAGDKDGIDIGYYFYISSYMEIFTSHDTALEDAALAFSALGSEQRLGVLRALVRAGPSGLSIGQLGRACGISGSTLTHHVRFLAHAGLVDQVKQGRSIVCAINYDRVQGLSAYLLDECCIDAAKGAK